MLEPIRAQLRPLAEKLRRLRHYPRDYDKSLRQLRKSVGDAPGVLPIPEHYFIPFHSYMEYHGPWLEQVMHHYWLEHGYAQNHEAVGSNILIPVPWTDVMVDRPPNADFSDLQKIIDETVDPDKSYFTVVEHELGLPVTVPDNVRVYASGGNGPIPIPLLKDVVPVSTRERDLLVTFMGNGLFESQSGCDVRMKMYQALKDEKDFIVLPPGGIEAYSRLVERSVFGLCPRGSGVTSYRLYECLQSGCIPIVIWEDTLWLPYMESLDWSEFAIVLHVDEVDTLAAQVRSIAEDTEKQAKMLARVAELRDSWFTYTGSCERIVRHLCGSFTAELPTIPR